MKATVISNPQAGRSNGPGIRPAIYILEEAGWTISTRETVGPGSATSIAEQAVQEGDDVVVVAGGDGTINEVIQALAGSRTALGYLPAGTVNVWAREVQLPLQVTAAARAMVDGRIERLDLGLAGDRYFLLMAGIGFDGEVVRRSRVLERHKQRFGVLPYLVTGLSTATLYRGADFELRYDGVIRRVHALMIVVSNTRLYGGRFEFSPEAVANDGRLDVCIVKGRGPLSLARQSLPFLLSGSLAMSNVESFRVRQLLVQANEPTPWQVDGELAGTTPVEFGVAPRALKAIVPRDFVSDLIA